MSALYYKEERDLDFYNTCEQIRNSSGYIPTYKIAQKAILKPASSFYLHSRQYLHIINNNGKRLPRNRAKRALHTEILKLYRELSHYCNDKREIVRIISSHPAPCFYISEKYAITLYYELLKKKHPSW